MAQTVDVSSGEQINLTVSEETTSIISVSGGDDKEISVAADNVGLTVEDSGTNTITVEQPGAIEVNVTAIEPGRLLIGEGGGGSGDLNHTFIQSSPSSSWLVYHGLNKFPSVSVVDSANTLVFSEVTYIDNNTLRIDHEASFSGKAYLN